MKTLIIEVVLRISEQTQSVEATGGVYKGQWRNQWSLIYYAYETFLVDNQ